MKKKVEKQQKIEINVIGFLDLFLFSIIFISLTISTIVPFDYIPVFLQLSCVFMWMQMLSMWIRLKKK